MKKKILSMMLIISCSSFGMEVTLEKAVDMAFKNNRDLKNSKIETVQQDLLYKETAKGALPTVSIEGGYTEDRNDSYDDGYFENGIILIQPIYSGGEIYYGIEGAKKNRELYNISYEKDMTDTRLEVIKEYITVLQLQKTLEVYETSNREKEAELKRQKEFYNLGMIDRSEILKVDSSLYETKSDIINTKNNIQKEKIILKKLMGISLEEDILLKDIDLQKINPEKVDLENDMKKAVNESLQSKKLKLNTEITKLQEKAAKSEFLPEVDLEYAYESSDEASFSDSANAGDWQWRIGVSFEWEIFNFGSSSDSYQRAKLETEKANISRDNELEELRKNIKSAYLEIQTLYSLIHTRKKSYETSKEIYEIDREKYANRLIDTVDYLQTESDLREAEVNYINVQMDYYQAYEEYLNLIK
ncbi:TolC family protein [uncultured Ilyobacter sp.]|uniref:TolC family protein n=1 Tax=uncultured Ilyobacter sp. TaxID=544433 RepID=UPI0029F47180|nr:TolC family protein [uncultured Ilyobacter sp.]